MPGRGRRPGRRSLAAWVVAVIVTGTLSVIPVAVGTAQAAANVPPPAPGSTLTTCDPTTSPSQMPSGQIGSGGCLYSDDQRYQLVMQTDGNLVLIYVPSDAVLWSSGTDGNPGAFFFVEANGYLGVSNPTQTKVLWPADPAESWPVNGADVTFVVQDDGNVVLYNGSSTLWSTGTNGNRSTLTTCDVQSPSTFPSGSYLDPGACLLSPDHDYELTMQNDGNLVLYYGGATGEGVPVWDSNTVEGAFGTTSMNLQLSGNLIVTNPAGLFWQSGSTAPTNSTLVLQNDGNLVLYTTSSAGNVYAPWSTGTNGDRGDSLLPGQLLTANQYLSSPNGQYQLQMGTGGVLVLAEMQPYSSYASPTGTYQCPLWTGPGEVYSSSSSNDSAFAVDPVPNSYAYLQTNGSFFLYGPGSRSDSAIWQADSSNAVTNSTLTLQDDGNLVLAAPNGAVVWESGTNQYRGSVWCTGEVLQGNTDGGGSDGGGTLSPYSSNTNQQISSLSGGTTYSLVMQSDCNLVLYGGSKSWSSGTDEEASNGTISSAYDNCYADLLSNGQIEVVAPNDGSGGTVLWTSSKTATTQPFPVSPNPIIGPFYAFTPESSGVNNPLEADASGNQIYPPPSKSSVLQDIKDVIKAIKAVVKIVGFFG